MKKLILPFTVAVSFLTASAVAQARDLYGYVFGLGGATGAIKEIRVIDQLTGFVHWIDGKNGGYQGLGGIRWFKNNLPVGRWYTIQVVSNGLGTKFTMVYMANYPWDCKAPDVTF